MERIRRPGLKRRGRVIFLAGLALAAMGLVLGVSTAGAANGIVCYLVADDGNGAAGPGQDGGAEDLLTRADPSDPDAASNEVNIGTGTGTSNVEASAIQPGTGVLYAMNLGQLGTIDLSSGVFSAAGSAVGSGSGSAGTIQFNDMDGLTFDPQTGTLYASQRIAGTAPDVLLQIDPDTGAHVPDAFGAGVDYVEITPLPDETKIDDLAITSNGTMYAIANVGGHADRLVSIDTDSGALTDIGATGTDDVEGLTAPPGGGLIGSTGQEGVPSEGLWDISTSTGAASNFRPLDNAGDYESVSCVAATGPQPSPSPSVLPTDIETGGPGPEVSPTVQGTQFVAETGSAAVPGLLVLGLMSLTAGAAMLWLGSTTEEDGSL